MPVGTSTGELYEDSFDFQVKSPLAVSNYLSQPGVVPKEGMQPPVPNLDLQGQTQQLGSGMLDALMPSSLKPMAPEETERRLRAFQEAKPGDKVPELENPAQSSILAGATDALGMLPVGGAGASSKSIFLGLGGMRRLLGDAKTEKTLNKAFDLIQDKVSWPDIAKQTGISAGADKQIRYEISDLLPVVAKLKPHQINYEQQTAELSSAIPVPLKDIIDHPDLFKAYPDMAHMPVYGRTEGTYYNENTDKMFIEKGLPLEEFKAAILHETQHAIQAREGLARGSNQEHYLPEGYHENHELLNEQAELLKNKLNKAGIAEGNVLRAKADASLKSKLEEHGLLDPIMKWDKAVNLMRDIKNSAREKYFDTAGEQEAYNVETRMDMNLLERRNTYPADTETTERNRQIVIKSPAKKVPTTHTLDYLKSK